VDKKWLAGFGEMREQHDNDFFTLSKPTAVLMSSLSRRRVGRKTAWRSLFMKYKHIEGAQASAEFSEEGGLLYRYWLDIVMPDESGAGRTACVVMQNPSYASREIADRSVRFMEETVFKRNLPEFEGVNRLIVVNLFARVQTRDFKGKAHDIGSRNDAALAAALRASEIAIIGWGTSNKFSERKAYVLGLLKKLTGKRLFKTRMHPSRGRHDGFIQPFSS
jgi:hypothetical protein